MVQQQTVRKSTAGENLYEWLQSLVFAWVFCILVFTFVGRQIGVDGPSMLSTLHDNDRIIVSNLFYTPTRGDVVVAAVKEFNPNEPIVKRIIATAGQTVDIDYDTATLYINGAPVYEPYINEPIRERPMSALELPLTVPEGYVFLMGDNRNHSTDSRDTRIGLVKASDILGKVYAVALPLDHFDVTLSYRYDE